MDVSVLPCDIIQLIKLYLPYRILLFLNKTYYLSFHYMVKDILLPYHQSQYIRKTIRQDHEFVFKQIIHERFADWFLLKNYQSGMTIYTSYLYFIKAYCLESDAPKCWNTLNDFLKKLGLCQNQHKKNTTRNVKWKP
jgi:hypothetical protein